jgi:uncharacterized protein (TIGR03435 family)
MNIISVHNLRNRLATLCACLIFAAPMCSGQTASPSVPTTSATTSAYVPTLTFDVASVKRSQVDINQGITVGGDFQPADSGNLYLQNFDLDNLFAIAYGVDFYQILGLDEGSDRAYYNIQAKSDDATNQKLARLPKEQLNLEHQHMIQVLLAERFHLKTHWETRRGETYDMVVAKPGKLQSTGAPPTAKELTVFGDHPIPPLYQIGGSTKGFEYIGHGASTADIAAALTGQFGKPVIDKTGLTGKYDFDLKYFQIRSDERTDEETNPWPPLETAIQQQLGLKAVPSHGPTRVLIIDHIEPLSEN